MQTHNTCAVAEKSYEKNSISVSDIDDINGTRVMAVLPCPLEFSINTINVVIYLSSTWREIDPDTAYVVCISVTLGFPCIVAISLGFSYMVMLQTFKRKRHCSGNDVAMGCCGHCVVPGAATVMSQWYGRYCLKEYARIWARHPATAQQFEFTAITVCQSIIYL